jgi:hypothetical protein
MGTSSGSAERDVRFVPIDEGVVFITNYRIIYAGTNLSHSVPWERIVSAEVFWDGLVLGVKGRSKNVQMKFPSPPPPGLLSAVMDHFLG